MTPEYRQYRIDQAHAYLERIRQQGDDCAGLKQQVDDARDRASGLKGIDYSAIRVQTSPSGDAIPNAIDYIMESIRGYVTVLADYEAERMRANESLMSMPDQHEAKALRMRYLLGWEWEKVQNAMGYKSLGGIMKLRDRALCSYFDCMPADERDAMPVAF